MPIPTSRPEPLEPRRPTPEQGLPSFSEEELALPLVNRSSNIYDDDEDPFSSIAPDDDALYEEEEEEAPPPPRKAQAAPRKPAPSKPAPSALAAATAGLLEEDEEEPRRPARSSKKEKKAQKPGYTEDTFIDEKTATLKPFGSGRRSAKVNEFDRRRNLRSNAKVVQWVVIGLLALGCVSGWVLHLMPTSGVSEAEARAIASSVVNTKGYPLERGGAFVEDFMEVYLNIDPEDQARGRALAWYYTGSLKSSAAAAGRSLSTDLRQSVVVGPTIYSSTALTENSARYTVGALVQAYSKTTPPPLDGSAAKWSFFDVNVYYDKAKDKFLILPESPTVTVPQEGPNGVKLPKAADIGSGSIDQQLTEEVRSVVLGFVKGYAVSSTDNHVALDQYLIPDPPVDLLKGLDGRYTLQDDSSVTYQAYESTVPNEAKVAVSVTWQDSISSQVWADYKSSYILTLQKQPNGKYLVSKFAPLAYASAPK